MLTGATTTIAAQSVQHNDKATEKLINAAKELNFKGVIDFAEVGGSINATFSNKDAIQVTPLQNLVQNIESFIKVVKTPTPVTVKSNANGKPVANVRITATIDKAVVTGNPIELAKQMIELHTTVDARFADTTNALLSAAQQYPLEQTNTTIVGMTKKNVLTQLITLLVEKGADAHVKDTGSFKDGLLLTATRLAGKDERYPLEEGKKPRALLFDAITKGMVNRAERSIVDAAIQTAYNRIGLH